MFAAIGPILAKAVFNLLINILQRSGILTGIEADAVKTGDNMLRVVEHMKTYQDYPPPAGNENKASQ